MNRAVRTLIRLVAAGFVIFGGLAIGLEFMRRRVPNAQPSTWQLIFGGILIVAGVTLFATSGPLRAARLTDEFED